MVLCLAVVYCKLHIAQAQIIDTLFIVLSLLYPHSQLFTKTDVSSCAEFWNFSQINVKKGCACVSQPNVYTDMKVYTILYMCASRPRHVPPLSLYNVKYKFLKGITLLFFLTEKRKATQHIFVNDFRNKLDQCINLDPSYVISIPSKAANPKPQRFKMSQGETYHS